MNDYVLVVTFPNQEVFRTPLLHLGHLRIAFLRTQKAPPSTLHMRPRDIAMWAYRDLPWRNIAPLLTPEPDPKEAYYRTMWSAGKVTVTYR